MYVHRQKYVQLTESLPGLKVVLSSEKNVFQALISTIRDRRVDNQNQTGLETSPKTRHTILTVHDFLASLPETSLVLLWLGLLSCGDNGDGDGENLGNSACHSTQTELSSGSRGLGYFIRGHVDSSHDSVPVEVGEVGRCNTQKRSGNSGVETTETFAIQDLIDGVHGRLILNCTIFALVLDLDLEFRLNTVVAETNELACSPLHHNLGDKFVTNRSSG